MDYHRLLEMVSLPFFRIRNCEEEREETTKAPRLWEHAWTYKASKSEHSFSTNAVGVVSSVRNENFNALIIVFHNVFQTCYFLCSFLYGFLFFPGILGIPCSGKPGRGYRKEKK